MQVLSENEAKEVIKKEYRYDPFEGSSYTSERVDGGWIFYYPKNDPMDHPPRAYIVSDNHKVLEFTQIGKRTTDELLKKMLASTSPYANPEGMQSNMDYLGVLDAGANLEGYDQSNETVRRILHTLGLRENEKFKAIDEEYILKDEKVYIDHVSDAYTLALKTFDAFWDAAAANKTEEAGKYLVQLFTIKEYIKLFRSDSVWAHKMQEKIDNISLLYRYEDSLSKDMEPVAISNKDNQQVDITKLLAYKVYLTQFEHLNWLYDPPEESKA